MAARPASPPGAASLVPALDSQTPDDLHPTLDTNVVNATFLLETSVPASRVVHMPQYPTHPQRRRRIGLLQRLGVGDGSSWGITLDVGAFVVGAFGSLLLLMTFFNDFVGMMAWLLIVLPLLWLALLRRHIERRWS